MTIPQWESCKICTGDHWTRDHPFTLRETLERKIDGRENDETMIVEVSWLWSLLDAPSQDSQDLQRLNAMLAAKENPNA